MHALYLEPEVRAAVVEHFGPGVLGDDGEVARPALAARVFADDAERRWLEELLHPRVGGGARALARRAGDAHPGALLVHEVPLLVRGRPGRSLRRRGADHGTGRRPPRAPARPHFDERAATQLPEGDKVARADHVYVNDGTPAELERWVADLVDRLRAA